MERHVLDGNGRCNCGFVMPKDNWGERQVGYAILRGDVDFGYTENGDGQGDARHSRAVVDGVEVQREKVFTGRRRKV